MKSNERPPARRPNTQRSRSGHDDPLSSSSAAAARASRHLQSSIHSESTSDAPYRSRNFLPNHLTGAGDAWSVDETGPGDKHVTCRDIRTATDDDGWPGKFCFGSTVSFFQQRTQDTTGTAKVLLWFFFRRVNMSWVRLRTFVGGLGCYDRVQVV